MTKLKSYTIYLGFALFGALTASTIGQGCISINKYPINKINENIIGSEAKEMFYEVTTTNGQSRCYIEIDGTKVDNLDYFLKRNYYNYEKENFIEKK